MNGGIGRGNSLSAPPTFRLRRNITMKIPKRIMAVAGIIVAALVVWYMIYTGGQVHA